MRLELTEGFQKDVLALDDSERAALFEVILSLPTAMGRPHAHAGLGLRKLHPSGIWEARVGLKIRVVFGFANKVLTLVRAGTHEEIRRYLKSL